MNLYKTTIYLNAEDVETLKNHFLHRGGYSDAIRRAVHNLAKRLRAADRIVGASENETQPSG